jgi:hypothetical protein
MTDNEEKMITKTAKKIVNKIVRDICDRSGLQNEWEALDEDIQKEIKDTWAKIIISEM